MALADRHTLTSVEILKPAAIAARWADNHHSTFPSLWLRMACNCNLCGSTESAVRHVLLTDVPDEPAIEHATIEPDGALSLDWGNGHISRFDPVWLRAHCLAQTERTKRTARPQVWGAELAERLPYMVFDDVRGDDDLHLKFLEAIRDLGFVILQDVPAERAETENIAALVGKLRLTNYGIFELKSKANPEIVGDMSMALNLHTDEPYRRDPPGITLFHIIAQSDKGGASTLADGLNLARLLYDKDREAFEILSSVPARFHRTLKEGRAFEAQAPIIALDSSGAVTGVRILDRGMAPVDVSPDQVVPFYRALRTFLALVYTGQGMITVKLQASEMLVFNNQRLLHGRSAFTADGTARHVRSCNVDLDEFHSSLRVAYRARPGTGLVEFPTRRPALEHDRVGLNQSDT